MEIVPIADLTFVPVNKGTIVQNTQLFKVL